MEINNLKIWGIPFLITGIAAFFIPPAIAEPLSPGNIIIAPTVCVNTTGGTCQSGSIIVDDGTCKRNVVVQPTSMSITGNRRTDARAAQIVQIGGCIPDGTRSTATVIANPQVMVSPTQPRQPRPPRSPDTVNPYDMMPNNMPR
ncbi:MAG: hypothetical protein ACXITR_08875 [Cyanobacterium sp.]